MANEVEIRVSVKDNPADLSAIKARLEELSRQRAEIQVDADDKAAVAKLALIDARIAKLNEKIARPDISVAGAARAEADIASVDLAMHKLTTSSEGLGEKAVSAGHDLGALSNFAMPALIGSAVALSPVILTLGFGLGGLGAAAAGVVGPIEKAAQASGGLRANMGSLNAEQQTVARGLLGLGQQYSAFEKDLEPQVVRDFGAAISLAGHLMAGAEPVAKATGNAIGTMLASLDTEFRSQQWEQFFGFMAQQAGPDVNELTQFLVTLTKALPPLLEALQPTATELLDMANDTAKIIDLTARLNQEVTTLGGATKSSNPAVHGLGEAMQFVAKWANPAPDILRGITFGLSKLDGSTTTAAASTRHLSADQQALADAEKEADLSAKQLTADWNVLVGNFATKDQALVNAAQAFGSLRKSIKQTGDGSLQSRGDFDTYISTINSSLSALKNAGASAGTLNGFLQQQIKRLESLGPLNASQQADLRGLRKFSDQLAQSTTGMTKAQQASATAMEKQLMPQISRLISATPTAAKDVTGLVDSIINTGDKSSATHNARQRLISDLESVGVGAGAAKRLVDKLQDSIDQMHGKNVDVGAHASGSGRISITESGGGIGQAEHAYMELASTGKLIPGFGGGDSVPALLEPGEAVIDKRRTRALAPLFKSIGVPGFSTGGVAGSIGGIEPFVGRQSGDFLSSAEQRFLQLAADQVKHAMKSAAAAGGGALGGDAAANEALARQMFPWPANMWPSYRSLEMSEAGFDRFARNPTSGAYGIPQALPPTKMPFAAQAAGGSHAGAQLSWQYDYIRSVYGNPVNAEGHEQAFHWYGAGGAASGLIGVGDYGRELIKVPNGSTVFSNADSQAMTGGAGPAPPSQVVLMFKGAGPTERLLLQLVQKLVRVEGGGSVQVAFGDST